MDQSNPASALRGGAPRFSVVIPARDVERFIGATIDSALGQSEPSLEVVVVVDGAKDDTAGVARGRQDGRVVVIEETLNGVSRARNRGLAEARGAFVVFLDGDDLLARDALQAFADAFDRRPDVVAVVGGHRKIESDGTPIPGEGAEDRPPFPDGDVLKPLLGRNLIVNGGAMAIRSDVARAVGAFDERLSQGEDWEFWCRVAGEGPIASLGQRAVLDYRQHEGSAFAKKAVGPKGLDTRSIDAIFEQKAVRARIPDAERRTLRRNALINNYWASARTALFAGDRWRFAKLAAMGVIYYPDSVFKGFLLRFLWRALRSK